MPPLVFDFIDIASRLRKDEFYTPTPKAAPVHVGVDLAKANSGRSILRCPRCYCINIEPSFSPQKGKYWCNDCNTWFS